ncbi:hypothetical protein [Marinimicrobium sp. ABcell2]|uniref:hypothetical protein n=1 Tax=Marinimicrobium sp. ABcell2 TaxID=3069751 RepID=UPI0027B44080|nr:hypothetical protein [Marinimicrobium sp. ABcell2]MDQ2075713.1 hypothetical protein [Marinimicrobium sp. ABcell2]
MKITLVKKILPDGSPCRKCRDVENQLRTSGWIKKIDEVLEAHQTDPDSPGMQLARQYQVNKAPFFIVERENRKPEIYTVYLKLVKEVLEPSTNEGRQ